MIDLQMQKRLTQVYHVPLCIELDLMLYYQWDCHQSAKNPISYNQMEDEPNEKFNSLNCQQNNLSGIIYCNLNQFSINKLRAALRLYTMATQVIAADLLIHSISSKFYG